ncbi:hypothetical protein [Halorussus pelagicus]|uniref:hypothetical protein n=1 Tax=Halorussus pelagicus TaxID=2505977 RepID=UPI000FFB50D0|nr:hypothetical protein [Halorussus pelagicus]
MAKSDRESTAGRRDDATIVVVSETGKRAKTVEERPRFVQRDAAQRRVVATKAGDDSEVEA